MVVSKEWNWKAENGLYWLDPCEESYYYSNKWKKEGLRSILDLGSGLGRHSILFAREGFQVTAVELSEYGVKHLIEWQKREGLDILTKHCDMKQLPFSDNAFDCIWAYHVVSHTDTEGFIEILNEIRRVLKPGGHIYLTLCSKDTWSFTEAGYPKADANTVIKTEAGPEYGIPHFYVNMEDILRLFRDFELHTVRHIDEGYFEGKVQKSTHYFIYASLHKDAVSLNYSGILGSRVRGTIDRPIGSTHPRRFEGLVYPINYGYVDGVMAADGDEQDIYLLGVDQPVSTFEGIVIAVIHRLNDIEDKWVVAPEGMNYTDEEILQQVQFQEKYFDIELYR